MELESAHADGHPSPLLRYQHPVMGNLLLRYHLSGNLKSFVSNSILVSLCERLVIIDTSQAGAVRV